MPRQWLYVGDFQGGTITVVDVDTASVDRTLDMGTTQVEGIDVAHQVDSFDQGADPGVIYLNRFPWGSQLKAAQGARPVAGDLLAYDVRDDTLLWRLPLDGKPNHISATRKTNLVYVPIRERAHVDVVDTERREVVQRIDCGWGPHSTELSKDEHLLYVGTIWQDTLDVLDLRAGRKLKSIPLGESVRPFAIAPDDSVAYVQLSRLHGFVVVDLEAGRRAITVHLPELPLGTPIETTYSYNINHGIALRHKANELWAAATPGNYVAVYQLPSLRLDAIIDVGRSPAYIELDDDEDVCFVSNRDEDTVSIIDMDARTERARVSVGRYPNRMKYVRVPDGAPSRSEQAHE